MDEIIEKLWGLTDNSTDDSYKQGVMDALKIVLDERKRECEQKIEELEYKLWISNLANLMGHTEVSTKL